MLYGDNPDRISLREVHLKSYAGEATRPTEPYSSTKGVAGFTAHVPGLEGCIGASYPTQMKISRSYVEQVAKTKPPSLGLGQKAKAPEVPADRDRWGNLRQRSTVSHGLAQSYLSTVYSPDRPRPEPLTSDELSATTATEQTMFPKQKERTRPTAPPHVAGYSGFRPSVRDRFGESYHRTELACDEARNDNAQGCFDLDESLRSPGRRGQLGAARAAAVAQEILTTPQAQRKAQSATVHASPNPALVLPSVKAASPPGRSGAAMTGSFGNPTGGGNAGPPPQLGAVQGRVKGPHRMQGGVQGRPGTAGSCSTGTKMAASFSRLTPRGAGEMDNTLSRGGRAPPLMSYDEANVGGAAPIPMTQMGMQQI